MKNIEASKTLLELIYAFEHLAYYCGLKPREFWDCRFKEVAIYCKNKVLQEMEQHRKQIQLFELVSDKVLFGNPYIAKSPKSIRLLKEYKELFPELKNNDNPITPEELKKKMREIMEISNKK